MSQNNKNKNVIKAKHMQMFLLNFKRKTIKLDDEERRLLTKLCKYRNIRYDDIDEYLKHRFLPLYSNLFILKHIGRLSEDQYSLMQAIDYTYKIKETFFDKEKHDKLVNQLTFVYRTKFEIIRLLILLRFKIFFLKNTNATKNLPAGS